MTSNMARRAALGRLLYGCVFGPRSPITKERYERACVFNPRRPLLGLRLLRQKQ